MRAYPSLSTFLADLAKLGDYHLRTVDVGSTNFGSRGSSLFIDATYVRVVDDTERATCRARLHLRRYSYGLDRVIDVEEVNAEFCSVYSGGLLTDRTTFPTFAGESLGLVA